MTWILLLIFLGTGGAPTSTSVVEFGSKAACQTAAQQIVTDMKALRAPATSGQATAAAGDYPLVRVYCFARE